MITLFGMPKAFAGHIGIIQRNAIRSWTLLKPKPEIILFGDDAGTSEAARELGVRHVPEVRRNSSGTPLLSDFFLQASRLASETLLCYINADIILLSDFPRAIAKIANWRSQLLAAGQRWDLDITAPLDFEALDWEAKLVERAKSSGFQRPPNWVDYFVFAREYAENLPPFAIGRTAWDNWLVWHALDARIPVLDMSESVMAIHQNHDYSHHKAGTEGVWKGEEARENLRLAGGRRKLSTMAEATHVLTRNGPEKKKGRAAQSAKRYALGLKLDVRMGLLDWTRPARDALGLRKKTDS